MKDFDENDSHRSCLGKTLSKSTYMIKGKRRWFSVFVNLTLSCPFLSSASGSLILFAPCNLHLLKWFFNTSSLIQACKQIEIDGNIFCGSYYYIDLMLVCSGLSPMDNETFCQQ